MKISKDIENFILEVKKVAFQKHNAELIKNNHHVYKIWSDGEITLEKAGELYGLRSLHMIQPAVDIWIKYRLHKICKFPVRESKQFTFAIVSGQDAQSIRKMMENF